MYSSSSSYDPFQYSTISSTSFTHSPNPTSLPFLQFPSPNFLHDNGDLLLSESLFQQHKQQQPILATSKLGAVQVNMEMNPAAVSKKAKRINCSKKMTKTNDSKQQQPTPRKRTGKKDRHSKIYTVHGPRDRRMRLSLQIARKFFDLQDMLGFDKASKTIDWLFSKSKSAIKEVADNFPNKLKGNENNGRTSVSISSDSEVVSGIKLTADEGGIGTEGDSSGQQKRSKKTENKTSLAKESRDKARARARERTKEKLKIKGKRANPSNLEQLGSDNVRRLVLQNENQGMKSSPVKVAKEEEEENANVGTCMDQMSNVDKYLGLTAAPKSTSIFDLSHPNGADFEDQFSGFQGLHNNNNRFAGNPDIKLSTGNVHVDNPNSIFMSSQSSTSSVEHKISTNIPNFICQDQNLTTLLMASLTPHEQNSSLLFMNLSNSTHQIPTPSLPMSTPLHSYFTTENNLSSTPNLPIKYHGRLY